MLKYLSISLNIYKMDDGNYKVLHDGNYKVHDSVTVRLWNIIMLIYLYYNRCYTCERSVSRYIYNSSISAATVRNVKIEGNKISRFTLQHDRVREITHGYYKVFLPFSFDTSSSTYTLDRGYRWEGWYRLASRRSSGWGT